MDLERKKNAKQHEIGMATDLYCIAKITTSKKEVLAKKDQWLQALNGLELEPITVIGVGKLTGTWEYEFPTIYDEKTDTLILDEEAELVMFDSPYVFSIRIYKNCLELTTIYKYRFLYDDPERCSDYLFEFRSDILNILNVFNAGNEIIYLADNACDKLSEFLECMVWEGISYDEVKQKMIDTKIPFVKDYDSLKLNELNYRNIKEYVYDDFYDILHPDTVDHNEIARQYQEFSSLISYTWSVLEHRKDKHIAFVYAKRALELLSKEASRKPKFAFAAIYKTLSYLFIKLERPDYLKQCDENWIRELKYFRMDINEYLEKLLKKGYSTRLLELFENMDFKNCFDEYFQVFQKLYVDDEHQLDFKSQKLYNDILKSS